MIITEFDKPLAAEDARKIALNNREDSIDRSNFRELMESIRHYSSYGHTRHITVPQIKERCPSDQVQDLLRSMGYKVTVKRAYMWDEEKKGYSDKPRLSVDNREQFITEITWG